MLDIPFYENDVMELYIFNRIFIVIPMPEALTEGPSAKLSAAGKKDQAYIQLIRNCWTEMLARSLGHIIILVHFRSKR
jgi:hypothetical protein